MHMKTDINMFIFNIEHFLSDIRGPRYLHLKKVYFSVGHPVYVTLKLTESVEISHAPEYLLHSASVIYLNIDLKSLLLFSSITSPIVLFRRLQSGVL